MGQFSVGGNNLSTLLRRKVTATALLEDVEFAESLVSLLRNTIDPKRFPWIRTGAVPTLTELRIAKVSTAVAATIQKVQTKRRGEEKKELEQLVFSIAKKLGYELVPTPTTAIRRTEDLPGPGQYMKNLTLGDDNADCVIGLPDRRRLVIECKSSNSAINSRKRLNKEVVKDAENWRSQFGAQVIPAATLRGVFNARYVNEAQATPLLIFWDHRLEDLRDFILTAN